MPKLGGSSHNSHTIRIDEEVYKFLQKQAVAFKDSPNAVLRRLLGLEKK